MSEHPVWVSFCEILSTGSVEAQTWGWALIVVAVVVALLWGWALLTRDFPGVFEWVTSLAVGAGLVMGVGALGVLIISKCPTTPPPP